MREGEIAPSKHPSMPLVLSDAVPKTCLDNYFFWLEALQL